MVDLTVNVIRTLWQYTMPAVTLRVNDIDSSSCWWLLCRGSGPSQVLQSPSADTGVAGPYLQIDDVSDTLHSEPDNNQL